MNVEVQYTSDCPNTPAILQLLKDLADTRADLTLTLTVVEVGGPTPTTFSGSPTVLIDGRNPFDGTPVATAACALHPPTAGELQGALDTLLSG